MVLVEIRAVAECLPAVLTLVGFLSSVNSLVLNKRGAALEGFPTETTLIGFLSSMSILMLTKG